MKEPSIFASGLRLAVRRPILFCSLFGVNLALGLMATAAPRTMMAPVLDHSLYQSELVDKFSLSAFAELAGRPEVSFSLLLEQSFLIALLYLAFTLFVAGGVVTAYSEDRALTSSEFFEASGRFFFPMVRLALLALFPFGALMFAVGSLSGLASVLGDSQSNPSSGFYLFVAGIFPLYLLALLIRGWFDVVQARMVDRREFSVIKITFGVFEGVMRRSPALLWAYLEISIISLLLYIGILWVWIRQSHAAFVRSFLLLECMLAISLAARLWQRAAAVAFYQRYLLGESTDSPTEPALQLPATESENSRSEPTPQFPSPSAPSVSQDAGHPTL